MTEQASTQNHDTLNTSPQDRLIVALDFPDRAQALAMADQLRGSIKWLKVGLELYLAEGRSIVEELRNRGHEVFLDLKLHDIPNTVASAVRSTANTGASLLTLHAAGGPAMLNAAVEAASALPHPPQLLAVTVLTSMDAMQLSGIGIGRSPLDQAVLLGEMAIHQGVNGLVCSPEEIAAMRQSQARKAKLVVPGIRPASAAADDQSRIATPSDAIRRGADWIVVGRPITRARNPAQAAETILNEIHSAWS